MHVGHVVQNVMIANVLTVTVVTLSHVLIVMTRVLIVMTRVLTVMIHVVTIVTRAVIAMIPFRISLGSIVAFVFYHV